jgi:hypothetical protein
MAKPNFAGCPEKDRKEQWDDEKTQKEPQPNI